MSDLTRIRMMLQKLWNEVESGDIEDEWVCSFLDDLMTRVTAGYSLSHKQLTKLEELFERY